MFRIWGRLIKDSHLLKDTVICIGDPEMTRTHKVYKALDDICYEFNISRPIWLDINKKDFIRFSSTRFYQDSFIDQIDFDYLDFRVIEEDSPY